MIVLDLEWNSGRYGGKLNEILQIGAVKLDRLGGRVVDTFCAYVRPQVQRTYSPAAAALPELSLAQASDLTFVRAAEDFFRWCGAETDYAAWGTADFMVLRENLRFWRMEERLPESFCDLQAAFARACGAVNAPALELAAAYCGIPETFSFHNALYDALYTALVGGYLTPEEAAGALCRPGEPPKRAERTTTRLGLPKKKNGLWYGPFASLEGVLNSRSCRRGSCPRCGVVQRTGQWASDDRKIFYSLLSCPAHGDFILRLETAKDKKGRLWGFPEVGETTPDNSRLLELAQAGESRRCQSRRSGAAQKRRRRRRRSPKKPDTPPEQTE